MKNQIKGSSFEVDWLFRSGHLTPGQSENAGMICKALGRYLFLNRNLLNIYCKQNVRLSDLNRCKRWNLITELEDRLISGEKQFYFQLGHAGYTLLSKAGYPHHTLNILAGRQEKSKILTFNLWASNRKLRIISCDTRYNWFECQDPDGKVLVAFFDRHASIDSIAPVIATNYAQRGKFDPHCRSDHGYIYLHND